MACLEYSRPTLKLMGGTNREVDGRVIAGIFGLGAKGVEVKVE